jgi:hypothetical protein
MALDRFIDAGSPPEKADESRSFGSLAIMNL